MVRNINIYINNMIIKIKNLGIYPKGGGCHICGLNDHLKSNCPKNPVNQIQNKRKNKLVEQYFSDDDN